jgi:uncharacterized membrane protein YoaK (UPF0700 family)
MTGTTTQVMIDPADRIYGAKRPDGVSNSRLAQMSTTILLFAIGCGAAALLYRIFGVKCIVVPPLVGTLQLMVRLIARL